MAEENGLVKEDNGGLKVNNEKFLVKLTATEDILMFNCECGNVHFRHAGYVEVLVPWVNSSKVGKVGKDSLQVMVCTRCRKAYVYLNDKMYDVTDHIDLKAWEKTEKEMQSATGPGGDC